MLAEKYSQQFATSHPETGEISKGAFVSREQAQALGTVLNAKITELSRKPELTLEEATLIDNTVDMASRSITWCVERYGRQVSGADDDNVKLLRNGAWRAIRGSEQDWPTAASQETSAGTLAVLNQLTGTNVSMRSNLHIRGAMEDAAMGAMSILGDVLSQNGGTEIDNYLAGNLQNLLAVYELAEGNRLSS